MPKLHVKRPSDAVSPFPNDSLGGDLPVIDPVASLRDASAEFADLATQLSERIHQFQNWLDKLPGKTMATCWRERDEYEFFGLRYARSGDWELQCAYVRIPQFEYHEGDAQAYLASNADWSSLSRSSVDAKMESIDLFPELLTEITRAAKDRVKVVFEATKKFDDFAKQFGILGKEGT